MGLHHLEDEEVVFADQAAVVNAAFEARVAFADERRLHALAITQPTSEGVNSITVCQPSVMMLFLPCQREDRSTIGPGSRNRRTWETGKSALVKSFFLFVIAIPLRIRKCVR